MSCFNQCGQEIVVNVPGVAGAGAAAGTNGTPAFSLLSSLTFGAANTSATATVSTNLWMEVGEYVFVSDGVSNWATMQITAFPVGSTQFTGTFVGNSGDATSGTISSGMVTPTGAPGALPSNTLANGLTGGTTRATAQTSLGLGGDVIISSGTALAQAITASFVQVGSIAVAIPAAGSWLYMASVAVDFAGTTFASSRTVTAKVRNTTQGVDLGSVLLHTQVMSTASVPTVEMMIPFILDATAVAADSIQILIDIDVIPTAGAITVTSGSLAAVPIRLT